MTLSRSETERIAAAIHALRPDWPVKSLCTFIDANLADRSYADAAIALAIVAVDPKTQTPRRVLESGPWWQAVQVAFAAHGAHTTQTPSPNQPRCDKPGHDHELAGHCGACRVEGYEPTATPTLAVAPDQAEINARGAALVLAALKAGPEMHGAAQRTYPTTDHATRAAGDTQED